MGKVLLTCKTCKKEKDRCRFDANIVCGACRAVKLRCAVCAGLRRVYRPPLRLPYVCSTCRHQRKQKSAFHLKPKKVHRTFSRKGDPALEADMRYHGLHDDLHRFD